MVGTTDLVFQRIRLRSLGVATDIIRFILDLSYVYFRYFEQHLITVNGLYLHGRHL
jgi:hypothetical protein